MDTEDEFGLRQKSLEVVKAYFEAMHHLDLEAWVDLWDEDAVVIIGFPQKGFDEKYKGLTETIKPGMEAYFSVLKSYEYTLGAIHPALDPEIVIVDWNMRATLKKDEKVYEGKNITVFKIRDGKIYEYQDYFNTAYFDIVRDNLDR